MPANLPSSARHETGFPETFALAIRWNMRVYPRKNRVQCADELIEVPDGQIGRRSRVA